MLKKSRVEGTWLKHNQGTLSELLINLDEGSIGLVEYTKKV